jgi:hypothetical protein
MKNVIALIWICLVMAGCSRPSEYTSAVSSDRHHAVRSEDSEEWMAYEHQVEVIVEENRVVPLHKEAEAACLKAVAEKCMVLQSEINTERMLSPTATTLRLRSTAAGVKAVLDSLALKGKIVSQITKAENLSRPIQDTAQKLAMLTDYRSKLEALRHTTGAHIDALIKINKELAQVQSELETAAAEKAGLMQKVKTELLELNITSSDQRSAWYPTKLALRSFGKNLADGFGLAISALAYLIPFGLMLGTLGWISLHIWRRFKTFRMRR